SAPKSRLIVAYFTRALILTLVAPLVRRLGEPLKTIFSVEEMHALLEKHGFLAVADQGLAELGEALSPALGRATKRMQHLRIVTADRKS
ncbi:MAG TPA: hypothetical protein VG963_14135, partial [Polyangiaceae bacterium]|nr:hypothetical protein [Polyangiaceae bacterium]